MTTVAELMVQLERESKAGHGLAPVILAMHCSGCGVERESDEMDDLAVEYNDDSTPCVVIEA